MAGKRDPGKAKTKKVDLANELERQKAFIELLVEIIPLPVFYKDTRGIYTGCNRAFEEYSGLPREEIIGKSVFDMGPRDIAEKYAEKDEELFRKPGKQSYKWKFKASDGQIREVLFSKASIPGLDGKITGLIGIITDITERRQMEEALKENESRLRGYIENAPVGVFIADEGGRYQDVNPEACRITGYSREELLSMKIPDLVPPDCLDESMRSFRNLTETGKTYIELPFLHKDGSTRLWSVNAVRISPERLMAFVQDITDRRQIEDALRESEYRHNLAGKLASFGWWTVDLATDRATWSDEVAAIHEMPPGYSPTVEDGINFYAPEYRKRIAEVVKKCAQDGAPYDEEMQIITKSGRQVWVRTIGMAQRDDSGRIVGLLGGFQDITRRKLVEEALREKSWHLENVIRGASVATWEWNVQTGETVINDFWADIIGYRVEELAPVSKSAWEAMIHPEDLKRVNESLQLHFEGKLPYYDCELRKKHKDGHWVWVHDRGTLMKRTSDGKPLMMFGTYTDITGEKQAMEMLQSERDLLRRYLDTADAFIVTLDRSGSITSLNAYGLELLGYEEETVIGKNWFDTVLPQPEGREQVYPVFQKIMNGDLSVYGYFENEVVTTSGRRRLMAWRNNCLQDADGQQVGTLSVGIDITDHRRAEQNYRTLFREMLSGFALHEIICDGHGKPVDYRFLAVNPAFERMTGLKAEEILGRTVMEVLPGTESYWIETYGRVALTGEPAFFESYSQNLDKYFEVSAYCPAPSQFACIFGDITERKRAEAEINRANRLYAFISQINQMVVRERDRDTIFSEACRIAVEYGRFRMAWIGLVDGKEHTIKPVAWSGAEEGYLSRMKEISTKNVPEGRGPTSIAIHEEKVFFCNDIASDPRIAPWREEALQRGYRASIALPIKMFGKVIGAFSLYAPEPDVFNEAELRLLEEVTGDIAYALEMLKNDEDRRHAEETLRKNEVRLRKSQQMAHVGSWEYDIATGNIWGSDEGFSIYGMDPPESNLLEIGRIEACIPEKEMVHQALVDLIEKNKPYDLEFEIHPADGSSPRTIISKAEVLRNRKSEPTRVCGVLQDITDRNRIEEKLKRAVQTTIQVLTQTVERRDPYTAGHQRRVAGLAAAIAAEMGLEPKRVEEIRTAGYVHDIGKISVPAEILSKPGLLSEVEMNIIREHPQHGREILMDVESSIPLDEIVYQHHERLDGSGYPRGLKAKEILLEARILAVADVVEAISSNRPYRAARGLDAALEEIESNKGTLYCPDAVDACLRLFREKGYVLEE